MSSFLHILLSTSVLLIWNTGYIHVFCTLSFVGTYITAATTALSRVSTGHCGSISV